MISKSKRKIAATIALLAVIALLGTVIAPFLQQPAPAGPYQKEVSP